MKLEKAEKIHEKKYEQNPALKDGLKGLKRQIYEATRDELFGAGLTLAQKHLIGKQQQKGDNNFEKSLEKIRDKL